MKTDVNAPDVAQERLVRPFRRIKWIDSREAFRLCQRTRRAKVIERINVLKCPPYNAHLNQNPDLRDDCIYVDASGKKFWLRWARLYGLRGDIFDAVLLRSNVNLEKLP